MLYECEGACAQRPPQTETWYTQKNSFPLNDLAKLSWKNVCQQLLCIRERSSLQRRTKISFIIICQVPTEIIY